MWLPIWRIKLYIYIALRHYIEDRAAEDGGAITATRIQVRCLPSSHPSIRRRAVHIVASADCSPASPRTAPSLAAVGYQ